MTKQSAGILAYRRKQGGFEIFLVHPGGPFWIKKDQNAWSVPKGEFPEGEDPAEAAKREFREETGFDIQGELTALGSVKQAGGKVVHCWAIEQELDATAVKSNTFELEWPPRSGRRVSFPEVDKAEWFTFETAQLKILKGQIPFVERLRKLLAGDN